MSTLRTDNSPPYSDWSYALRGTTESQQLAILAVLDIFRRMQQLPVRSNDLATAEKQLDWWQQQCTSLSNATHPSVQALAPFASIDGFNVRLQRLLQLTREDVHFSGFQYDNDMRVFFRTRGALLIELLAMISQTSLSSDTAADLGYVAEYQQYLSQFPRYSAQGVIYFSRDARNTAGFASDEAFLDSKHASEHTGWVQIMNTFSNDCLQLYQNRKHAFATTPELHFLLRYFELQKAWLLATQRARFPLYHYRVQLGSLQRRWICLRTNLMTLLP